jgi:hypothetical protein
VDRGAQVRRVFSPDRDIDQLRPAHSHYQELANYIVGVSWMSHGWWEGKAQFDHLIIEQGKNLVHLIDRPDDDAYCFRLHKDRYAVVFFLVPST